MNPIFSRKPTFENPSSFTVSSKKIKRCIYVWRKRRRAGECFGEEIEQ